LAAISSAVNGRSMTSPVSQLISIAVVIVAPYEFLMPYR
jgi:hypothetical protein